MGNPPFPDYVENFVDTLNGFLGAFNAELRDCTDEQTTVPQTRVYELLHEGPKTKLVVHRTLRSMDQEVGEFRARVATELPRELGQAPVKVESFVNKFASLGAFMTRDEGVSVGCQSLIPATTYPTTAGIMAAAMIHAGPSILQGMQRGLNQGTPDPLHPLSAWSDLDFEQIHYDYSHRVAGQIVQRGWWCGHLLLQAVDDNPYWGGGLFIRLLPGPDFLRDNEHDISINELNLASWLADDAPFFGAWCKDDDTIWYVSFAPNFLKEVPGFVDIMIDAATTRLAALGNLVETILATRSQSKFANSNSQ
jgi:hypothetical protein